MIKISLKGLAKFMTSDAAGQRKVLRDYKYPDPEGRAQATYYREARDFITVFHRDDHDRKWLVEKADLLYDLAYAATGQTKARLMHNARALLQYEEHFGNKSYEILGDLKLNIAQSDVRVTVYPDLYVEENGLRKIVKLEFSSDPPKPTVVKIISQCMYEAAQNSGLKIAASQVLYLDVPRGKLHKGARVRARMRKNIEAACQNIKAIWDSI